ncbi:MAG: histidinol dehydrogenase [Verrucomicrobiales bacterium]|nr:histidinol dehydrogenase [Verrucomicrobiales bacterium]MCP5528418.1 histidinol dehydrogenase [Verrucomicrobiales bacterium]
MNIVRYRDAGYAGTIEALARASSLFDPEIERRTRAIIEAVQADGDAALADCARRFDQVELRPGQFAVTQAELLNASVQATAGLRRALRFAIRNIGEFSRRSLRKGWSGRNPQGAKVGEKYDPFNRVGLYVPGGTAPLVSTTLMTIVLARVAGCREIVVCTPCNREGAINPALLLGARMAGATEIYRLGGAHAIAALALGTPTIRPVQKIFGPGNAYVVAAKRLLFGHVAIDLLPGPSEVLVLADDSADPAFVAADLLAQAEHGSGHERVWLVTPSARLMQGVEREIKRQLPQLTRRDYIEKALAGNGWLIQVKSLAEGVELANRIAPEHCEIVARNGRALSRRIVTAGAIFLGAWSPTVLGDYVAGPSHTLPTGGAGRSFPGLTADQFQRRTSVVEYSPASLRRSIEAVQAFAELEGLDAHGRSASIRLDGDGKPTRKGR